MQLTALRDYWMPAFAGMTAERTAMARHDGGNFRHSTASAGLTHSEQMDVHVERFANAALRTLCVQGLTCQPGRNERPCQEMPAIQL